ncbi:hypothetical protein [Lysobacter fragariae]
MIRKLLVPALAAGLLAGCVTDYAYREDGGGYYYGQPGVEYRYQDYGYYPGYYYPYGYGSYYGNPYSGYYGYPYYGYPYSYGYPYWRHHRPRPPQGNPPPDQTGGQPRPDDNRNDSPRPPPWRDFNRGRVAQPDPATMVAPGPMERPSREPMSRPMPRPMVRPDERAADARSMPRFEPRPEQRRDDRRDEPRMHAPPPMPRAQPRRGSGESGRESEP